MYKLIACDLDETLLGHDAMVSQRNLAAIKQARDLGIRFVPASGRGYLAMQKTLQQLNLAEQDNQYTISFNGGAITENSDNRILELDGISLAQVEELVRFGEQYDVCMHIYTAKNTYMYRLNTEERNYIDNRINGYVEIDSLDLSPMRDEGFIKVLYQHLDPDFLKSMAHAAAETFQHEYARSYSANRYLEYNQKGVSKGQALLKLAKKFAIDPDQIIAIGDNNNDISMLEIAGLAVCVQNATEEVKSAADYICQANNDESAVAEMIEKFILAK